MPSGNKNLPAEFAEVAQELGPDDEVLGPSELREICLFNGTLQFTGETGQAASSPEAKAGYFDKKYKKFFGTNEGTVVLRKCPPGRRLCSAGDAGATAFFILRSSDVIGLRKSQLQDEQLSQPDRQRIQNEIAELSSATQSETPRQVLEVRLPRGMVRQRSRNPVRKLLDRFTFGKSKTESSTQIALADGPDVDSQSRTAKLSEGDLFGEMSCRNRDARSATVVATETCYMVEFMKNVYQKLRGEDDFKNYIDAVYRERVLSGHLRKLDIFSELSDDAIERLKDSVELVSYEAGDPIFYEGDPSDSFFVVQQGAVKVVQGLVLRFESDELDSIAKSVADELRDLENKEVGKTVKSLLPPTLLELLDQSTIDAEALRKDLNEMIDRRGVIGIFGKKKQEALSLARLEDFSSQFEAFPDKTNDWSQIDEQTFNRVLLESVLPSLPPRFLRASQRRVLAYLGRGEFFGEMGVMLEQNRRATCIAYDHPDTGQVFARGDGEPSGAELVRIDRELMLSLAESEPSLKQKIDAVIGEYQTQDGSGGLIESDQSEEIEKLGLAQGQKLMLIDLDRCTRCGECVNACVDAHDDGNTRLYLDGPRYDKYLVPLACRKCLDPVCMIGCPVSAIVRGEDNEILIHDWCVGCEKCAKQCPYGSIQMTPVEPMSFQRVVDEAKLDYKPVDAQAVVCDMCTSTYRGEPACVYACPHDAALRVNGQDFLLADSQGD